MKANRIITSFVIILLFAIMLSSMVSAVQNADLWAYWSMDTADNNASGDPQDQSGNSRHLAGISDPAFESGKIGDAATFDGSNDYFNLGSTWFTGSEDFSANMWGYRDNSASTDYGGGDDCADFGVWTSTTNHQGFVRGTDNAAPVHIEGDAGVGRWIMTTMVFDSATGNYSLWVNGTLLVSETGSGFNDCTSTHGDFSVGARAAGAHPWPGEIDDMAIWLNYKLTQDDIDFLYNDFTGRPADAVEGVSNTSSWNVTSGNVDGTPTNNWNTGGEINITTDLLSFTVTATDFSNMSCALDYDANYTTMVANNSIFKATTTNTTSHSMTLGETISTGTHNLYCAFILTSDGTEAANAQSGALKINKLDEGPNIPISTDVSEIFNLTDFNVSVTYTDVEASSATVYFNLSVDGTVKSATVFSSVANGTSPSWNVSHFNYSKWQNVTVYVEAVDTAGSSSTNYTWFNVSNSNPYYTVNSSSATTASGQQTNITFTCADVDTSDTITYSQSNSSLASTIGSSNGLLQLNPAYPDVGTHTVNVVCSDGNLTNTTFVFWTVDEPGAGGGADPLCTQYLQVDSFTGLTINYNLTVQCVNPTASTNYTTVTITPDSSWTDDGASAISILANTTGQASFYNISSRGVSDGPAITIAGAVITNNISLTTNDIDTFVPIDPPYAFTKDGIVDCDQGMYVNQPIELNSITFRGIGDFLVSSVLSVGEFNKNETDCRVVINESGSIEVT